MGPRVFGNHCLCHRVRQNFHGRTGFTMTGLECGRFWGRIVAEQRREDAEAPINTEEDGREALASAQQRAELGSA